MKNHSYSLREMRNASLRWEETPDSPPTLGKPLPDVPAFGLRAHFYEPASRCLCTETRSVDAFQAVSSAGACGSSSTEPDAVRHAALPCTETRSVDAFLRAPAQCSTYDCNRARNRNIEKY